MTIITYLPVLMLEYLNMEFLKHCGINWPSITLFFFLQRRVYNYIFSCQCKKLNIIDKIIENESITSYQKMTIYIFSSYINVRALNLGIYDVSNVHNLILWREVWKMKILFILYKKWQLKLSWDRRSKKPYHFIKKKNTSSSYIDVRIYEFWIL